MKNEQGVTVSDPCQIHISKECLHNKKMINYRIFAKRTTYVCPEPSFATETVRNKLLELKPNKSVSVDGVNANVLKGCADSMSLPLSMIFKQSLDSSKCTEISKRANIAPLYKKRSKSDPGNYRPISLTSIVCKVMECVYYVSAWLDVLSGVPQGSVFGPILFIIFINELTEIMKHPCKLYADDTKIIAKAVSYEDKENLQSDINNLVLWCNTLLMSLNVVKCEIMHIGKSNTQHTYTIDTNNGQTNVLTKTAIERDLGVIISTDLKWHHHTTYAMNKANKILGMINKTFNHMSVDLMKITYTTYVRPHHAVSAC
jgi:hypothetical protein